jgi:ABC-type lipoprotein release transport system permease subunit
MKLLTYLAWKNLWRNRRRSWISISSVIFAVTLSVFLESMDRGSQEAMVRNTVRYSTGYINIQDSLYQEEPNVDNVIYFDNHKLEKLKDNHPDIAYVVPRIEGFVLAVGEQISKVAYVKGIDLPKEDRFNGIGSRIEEGVFFNPNEREAQAVVGKGLAQQLSLSTGDTIVLLGQGHQGTVAAGKFVVTGIVRHPIPEWNNSVVFLPLADAQWYYGVEGGVSSLMIVPKKVGRHKVLAKSLVKEAILGPYAQVYTWEELQPELLRTLAFDRAGTLVFLLILYAVIGFGIFGTVLTMTLEREKEFGTLVSIGLQKWKLSLVVLLESMLLNFIGVVLGILVALPLILYFFFHPIPLGEEMGDLMADYGLEPVLFFSMDPYIFINQAIIVFFIAMLIVLYPIFRVFSLDILIASKK